MLHLEEGTIHAWLDGELSSAEQADVERHVAMCAECGAAVAEARGMIAGATRIVSALDVVRSAGVAPRQPVRAAAPGSVWRSLRFTPTRAALAASLLVAAGALLTIRHDTSDSVLSSPMAASAAAPNISGAMPSVPAATSPAPASTSMDSIAPRAAVTRQSMTQPPARASVPNEVAAAKRADSATARAVSAANAIAGAPAASASTAAMQKVAAALPVAAPVPATSITAASGAVAADVRSVVADAARRRFQAAPMQLQEVVTTGASGARNALDIAGCYQIESDSGAFARLLPNHFALERATSAAAANVVRAVTPEGRVDSVVTGSKWVQVSTDKAQIQSIVGTRQQTVNLRLTSLGGVSGEVSTTGGIRPIGVVRAACRP